MSNDVKIHPIQAIKMIKADIEILLMNYLKEGIDRHLIKLSLEGILREYESQDAS